MANSSAATSSGCWAPTSNRLQRENLNGLNPGGSSAHEIIVSTFPIPRTEHHPPTNLINSPFYGPWAVIDGEIVTPSALAVLRLITSSIFAGCSTGNSCGHSEIAQCRGGRREWIQARDATLGRRQPEVAVSVAAAEDRRALRQEELASGEDR